jgi:hypothetical protein
LAKNYEKNLDFHLNRWQSREINDNNCYIELKILQRTVRQFIHY